MLNKTVSKLAEIPNHNLFNKEFMLSEKVPCPLKHIYNEDINYRNIELLKKYISGRGKIISSRITGVSYKKHKLVASAIKRARAIALLPYSHQ